MDWTLVVLPDGKTPQGDERSILQVRNSSRGWHGAKHFLSSFMTEQEVVGQCFTAIMRAMENEVRQNFLFEGEPIYQTYLDPHALAKLSKENRTQHREGEPIPLPVRPVMEVGEETERGQANQVSSS